MEYLVAEKIWYAILNEFLGKNREGDYYLEKKSRALQVIDEIFGSRRLSVEVVSYLIEIIANCQNINNYDLVELHQRLGGFLDYFLKKDFLYSYSSSNRNNPIQRALSNFYGYWIVFSHLPKPKSKLFLEKNKVMLVEILNRFNNSLSFVNLSHMDLGETRLIRGNLPGVNFKNSNLKKANLPASLLHNANFINASLQGANLNMSSLTEANFEGANLSNSNFKNVNLVNAKFVKATLDKTKFSDSRLNLAIFENCVGLNANFERTSLLGCRFSGVDFCKSSFRKADLESISIKNSTLQKVIFQKSNLSRARIENCDFKHSDFKIANTEEATFNSVDLHSTSFEGANLKNVKFYNCKGLTLEQLKKAFTLYGVKGLEKSLRDELGSLYPELFDEPIHQYFGIIY